MKALHRLLTLQNENNRHRATMDEQRPRFERIAGRHDNGTAPRAVSSFQLFQTPAEIAARLAALLDLQPGARILEPSAGLGRLLDAVQPYAPGEVVAVEMAGNVADELEKQGRAGVRVIRRDFLEIEAGELGSFDAVIMNPPFHMRADIRHIEHARTFLKFGGKLAAVCMDTEHRRTRLRPDALDWIELGPDAFKEAATGVPTCLATFTL